MGYVNEVSLDDNNLDWNVIGMSLNEIEHVSKLVLLQSNVSNKYGNIELDPIYCSLLVSMLLDCIPKYGKKVSSDHIPYQAMNLIR